LTRKSEKEYTNTAIGWNQGGGYFNGQCC